MTLIRIFVGAVIGAGATIALVLGVAVPASASSYQYYSGYLGQNAVKFSPTFSTIGGYVVLDPVVRFITVHATVSGLGSFAGPGQLTYSHARRTTYAYCKWTASFPQGVQNHLACSLTT